MSVSLVGDRRNARSRHQDWKCQPVCTCWSWSKGTSNQVPWGLNHCHCF